MPTLVKPQVLVFQEFKTLPAEAASPLRAHISGPNAKLHRHAYADEKALISVGGYNPDDDASYVWPGRTAGGLVDLDSVKLFVDNAKLQYFEDLIGDDSNSRGTVTAVSGKKNRIKSAAVAFKSQGDTARHSLLYDRDVRIGDTVYLRGISDDQDCTELELWTKVAGFAAELVDPETGPTTADAANADADTAAVDVLQTAGANNGIVIQAAGTYNGLTVGLTADVYTIRVVASSVAGCNAAKIRITTASGKDNVAEMTPEDFDDATDIGSLGLQAVFVRNGDPAAELTVGQIWTIEVAQNYAPATATVAGDYAGLKDDTYVIEVTKGGKFETSPKISVTTVKGLDRSGPTTVSALATAVAVGTKGLTVTFSGAGVSALRLGDKFYCSVETGAEGPVRTLILRDDLPTIMRDAVDLDLKLFIQEDIELTARRLSDPPNLNFETESTQVLVSAGATAYSTTWADGGVPQALPVMGGELFVEYREFLTALANQVNFINDVADLELIPGQLDEQNPLKWGVYKALQNSGGTQVGYTAVADPSSLDSWQTVLDRIQGRDDIYNLVALTFDREVLGLFQGHCDDESSPEAGNWKGMFAAIQAKTTKMLVGESSADVQSLTPTSTDGELVLATLEDNPAATGTQYTLLSVAAGNSNFISYGVRAGDIVRGLFTVDVFGDASYTEFVVDSVLSENSLILLSGHTAAVSVAQKIEVWRSLTKNETKEDLQDQAQSFANRRVVCTWPDIVGTAGNAQAGYFLSAALAGLVSGVAPHRPLTNVSVSGFDDVASRTRDYFSATQLAELASSGIWIVTEDRDGTIYNYHALTSDTTGLNQREESIRRNVDAMSYVFLKDLRQFIGRFNVSEGVLTSIRLTLTSRISEFTRAINSEIGGQLLSGSIRELYQHPLLADRIVAVLDLSVPAPLNNIELHLVA